MVPYVPGHEIAAYDLAVDSRTRVRHTPNSAYALTSGADIAIVGAKQVLVLFAYVAGKAVQCLSVLPAFVK